jgi:hypothetical protein
MKDLTVDVLQFLGALAFILLPIYFPVLVEILLT